MRPETIENAVQRYRDELFRFGTALIFIVGTMLFTIVRIDWVITSRLRRCLLRCSSS